MDDSGIKNYAEMISLVLKRIKAVDEKITGKLNAGVPPDMFDLEFSAIQLRLACEGILFSTFSLHSAFVDELAAEMRKGDGWEKIRKRLETVNPRYMPEPTKFNDLPGKNTELETDQGRYISGQRLFRMWGKLSEILHNRNPLKPKIDSWAFAVEMHSFMGDLIKMLSPHTIYLPDLNVIYLVQTPKNNDGVHWTRLSRIVK
jgi:hypothetical protein